jgi:hypothetical protein
MDSAYNEQHDDRIGLGKARDAIVNCRRAMGAARFERQVSLDSSNHNGQWVMGHRLSPRS